MSWRGPLRYFLLLSGLVLITLWWGVSVDEYLSSNFTFNPSAFMPIFTILVMLPIPIAVYLGVQLNRQDDLFADAKAAMMTQDPEAVISAIEKIAASKGNVGYPLFGAGYGSLLSEEGLAQPITRLGPSAVSPSPEERWMLPLRLFKYMFVNPLERGTGSELDRRWMVSVRRYFHDNLTVITHPRRKDRENLRAERGERGGTVHERLAALRSILDGGSYLEMQTLKIPSDAWE